MRPNRAATRPFFAAVLPLPRRPQTTPDVAARPPLFDDHGAIPPRPIAPKDPPLPPGGLGVLLPGAPCAAIWLWRG